MLGIDKDVLDVFIKLIEIAIVMLDIKHIKGHKSVGSKNLGKKAIHARIDCTT